MSDAFMKRLRQITAGLLLATGSVSLYAAERVGDFALIDHEGFFHHMAWYNDQRAVVILVQANGSDAVRSALPEFSRLQQQYTGQGVVFFLMNPGSQEDRAAVQAEVAKLGTTLPVLMDDTQLVAELLGVSKVGEAVIYDPKSFEVLYRGPVQEHLAPALKQFLADGSVAASRHSVNGENIEFAARAAHTAQVPSYEKEIAPIIAENCASCHRAGGIAPFALDSHLAAQGWSPMIREVLLTKRMPPGQVDNKVGKAVADVMNLKDEELQKLVHWINAGTPVDSDIDPLAQLTWPDSKWQLGEPDLVVKIPPQTIPATGIVDYMNVPVDLGLTEDRWLRGSEVVAGDPTVLHHIITTVVPPEGMKNQDEIFMELLNTMDPEIAMPVKQKIFAASVSGTELDFNEIVDSLGEHIDISPLLFGTNDPNMATVAGYVPGARAELAPDNVGGLLRAGSKLNLQMHYTTSGRETVDASEIALYFYPEGVVPEERMAGGVANTFSLQIPPNAKDHEVSAVVTVPREAYIHSLMPHMHFRGSRMSFTAQYPDGSEELILSVPDYSFNWQLVHQLEEPLRVPAGTRIIATGAYDNSRQNLFNPDPDAEVVWGEQSWEEMFMGFYEWKYVDQSGGR